MSALPKPGDRIRLTRMGEDDPCPIEPGSTGTVYGLFDFGDGTQQIQVEWDGGRGLNLVHPIDTFEILEEA